MFVIIIGIAVNLENLVFVISQNGQIIVFDRTLNLMKVLTLQKFKVSINSLLMREDRIYLLSNKRVGCIRGILFTIINHCSVPIPVIAI